MKLNTFTPSNSNQCALTEFDQFLLAQHQRAKYAHARHTTEYLQNYTPIILPFLIKLQFIRTVRATIPKVRYQYLFPVQRKYKSHQYRARILANSRGAITALQLYDALLEI